MDASFTLEWSIFISLITQVLPKDIANEKHIFHKNCKRPRKTPLFYLQKTFFAGKLRKFHSQNIKQNINFVKVCDILLRVKSNDCYLVKKKIYLL